MQLRDGLLKITWLLMLGNVISCISEKDAANETFIFKNLVMKNSKEQKIFGVNIGREAER